MITVPDSDIEDAANRGAGGVSVPGAKAVTVANPFEDSTPAPAPRRQPDFDAAAAALADSQRMRLRSSLYDSLNANPDMAARATQLSRQNGAPPEVNERNYPEAKRNADLNEYDRLLETSPRLAAYLGVPQQARMAHDDVPALSGVESYIGQVRGPQASFGAIARGLMNSPILGAKMAREGIRMQLADLFGQDAVRADAQQKYSQASLEADINRPEFASQTAQGIYSGGESFLRMTPGLAASIFTRSSTPILATIGLQTETEAYGKYRARGATPGQALAGAAGEGAVEVGTELLPMGFLTNRLGKAGAGEFLTGLLARELPTEQVATFVQDAIDTAVANPDKTWSEFWQERPSAAYQTLLATATQSSILGGINAIASRQHVQQQRAAQAEHNAQMLADMANKSQESKLRERDAPSFSEFVRQAAEDGPVTEVYVSAATLNQSGLNVEQLAAASPAIATQFNDALATGGDIRIPVQEFATNLSAPEIAGVLIPHLKTDPAGMTQAEAANYMQSQGENLRADVERTLDVQAGDTAFKTSRDAVTANIAAQLQTANRFTPEVNQAYASLVGNFYAVQAAKLGITPEEMAALYPIEIRAHDVPGGRKLDNQTEQQDSKGASVNSIAEAPDRTDGTTTKIDDSGLTIVHGSGNPSLTADDVQIIRQSGQKQGKRGRVFGGFYGTSESDAGQAEGYANMMGGAPTLYDVRIAPGTKVLNKNGDITRLSESYINELTSHGYGLVIGKDPRGRTEYVVIDKSAIAEMGPRGTLQQGTGSRGSITLSDNITQSPSIISIFQYADLSTFLHEAGHFFLEVQADIARRPNAPETVKQDMQATLDWLGVPDQAAWDAMTIDQKREQHEQFARGFEAYLFEGKAPSVEMAGVFQRFRAWMLNVYRSLTNLNVQLTDEVRGVFDRMLASNEQITEAEALAGYGGMFQTKPEFMTDDEWRSYQNLGQQATQDAVHDLESRSLRDMQWLENAKARKLRELQRDAATKRKAVRTEVTTEVMAEPINQAREFLAAQKQRPDMFPEHTAALEQWREQRDAQPKEKRADWVAANPEPVRPRTPQQQWDADRIAYKAAQLERIKDELIAANPDATGLKKGQLLTKNKRIMENEAERLALEWEAANPKPKLDALPEINMDTVAELFGFTSGDHLEKALKETPSAPQQIKELTDQRMLEQYGDLTDAQRIEHAANEALHNEARLRAVAAELTALEKATNVREDTGRTNAAGRPLTVATLPRAAKAFAEATIARLLVRNLKPAQYTAAAARAAKNADAAFKKGDIPAAATEKRNQLIQSYAARAADAALAEAEKAVEYFKKFSREGTRKALDADYLDQIDALLERFDLRTGQSLRAIDRRKSLLAWAEAQRQQGFEPEIPEQLLDEAQRRSYKDMTVEELRGLRDTIKQIEHLGRLKERLLTAKDKRRYEAIRDDIVASIDENAGDRKADTRTATTNLGRAVQGLKRFWAAHLKVATLARVLDGGKDGGPMWEYFVRAANEAGDKEVTMRAEATIALSKIMDPVFKLGKMGGKGQFFPSINRSLNRESRLAIALNFGNESNIQRLLGGEGWTREQVKPVLDSLTKAEWDAVQAIWDHFESYRPLIEAKERRVYGTSPQWLEPTPVQTTHGEYRGGYYPVKYDPAASIRAEEHLDAEGAQRQLEGAYTSATTRRSFTKTRAEAVVGRPLLYSLAGLYNGVNDVIHDLSWHEWLIDVNRLLRSQSIDRAIREHYGPEVKAQFKSWVNDIAEGEKGADNAGEWALGKLRQNVSVAGLGYNVVSAAIQGLGMTQSIVRVGPAWVGKGIKDYLSAPIATTKMVNEKSEFMRNRQRTRFRELNELRNKVQGQVSLDDTIKQHAYVMMMRMQQTVDVPTWVGAYEKALASGNDEARAVSLADQSVIDAQGGGQIKDQASIERGGQALKLFTVFYSFMNTALNLGVGQTMTANSKAKLASDYLLLYTVPAVLGFALKSAITPGDDDDWDWGKLAAKMTAEQISYLMGLMVVVREFGEVGKMMAGQPSFGYQGPAGVRIVGDTAKFVQQANQGEFDDSFRKASVNLVGDLTGLPSAQINRSITGAQALAEGKTENPAAVLMGYQEKK